MTDRVAWLGVMGGSRPRDGRLAHDPRGEINAQTLVKAWATVFADTSGVSLHLDKRELDGAGVHTVEVQLVIGG